MAGIRYSLIYESTRWEDVCRIERDGARWAALIDGAETFIERTPEVVPSRTAHGNRVMPTAKYVRGLAIPMYITFAILKFAVGDEPSDPGDFGEVSLRHVITEADARAGLYFDYDPDFEWTGECP